MEGEEERKCEREGEKERGKIIGGGTRTKKNAWVRILTEGRVDREVEGNKERK